MDGAYTYMLTVPAGETYGYLNPIEIIDDQDVENTESFFVLLTAGTVGTVDAGRMLATVNIIDNDGECSQVKQ